jgi:transcriptional regulator with XRE-family HTH domain
LTTTKEAIKAKGLSQKKLGILTGMNEFSASARINKYEKGFIFQTLK